MAHHLRDDQKHPMTIAEMANALGACAVFDGRIIPEGEGGEAVIAAWHDILGHFTYIEVMAAIKDYYTNNDRRIMPSDIYRRCEYDREQWRMTYPSFGPGRDDLIPWWSTKADWIAQWTRPLPPGEMMSPADPLAAHRNSKAIDGGTTTG